jgi:hypothetical protein
MGARIARLVVDLGEEGFLRRMEDLSGAERREIFHHLDVPSGGASVSARQRNAKRIGLAWERLASGLDEHAAEAFARGYLARRGMPMIIEFLDRLGVPHEGGYLKEDEALAKLGAKEVGAALAALTAAHETYDVRLYAALMSLPGAEDLVTPAPQDEARG